MADIELPRADVRFTTLPALFEYIEEAIAIDPNIDSVTVSNVAPQEFTAIDQAFQARGRKARVFYLAENKTLIITLPNKPHELLHLLLYSGVERQIQQMGLYYSWSAFGSSRFPARSPADSGSDSSTSQGEADSGGGPFPERKGESGWPTIVIEAGFTQSLESLRAKIGFWFARSDHDVKIVVLVKAFPDDQPGHAQKRILIEQWQERYVPHSDARPGATTTRLSAMSGSATVLQPVCIQTINIVWAVPGLAYDDASEAKQLDRQSFNVLRGPLRLEFARLFLRQPVGPMSTTLCWQTTIYSGVRR